MGIYIKTFILSFLISIGEISGQIGDMIYNPYNLWVVGEDKLLVNDIADKEQTLKLFNFSSGALEQAVRSGRGPGEVSSMAYKRSTRYSNGDILLWDSGGKRIMRYSEDLEYRTDLAAEGSVLGKIFQAALINDSTLLTVDFSEEVLKAWRIQDNKISDNSLLWSADRNEYKELSPLANFTLLQTLFFSNYEGGLYITFEYSSMVIGVNEDGIVFINDEPDNIPLPPNDEESEKSGRYSLPTMGKHPEGARDISATDKFVYVLLNGETISKMQQIRYMANFDALIEKTNHTKRLMIYDRLTGEFLREIELPLLARQAKVQNDYIFLLNTLDDRPMIKKYKLSDL